MADSEKYAISSDYGFLAMIMGYVQKRIKNLNSFCVICDFPHVFAVGNMLKPGVCSRELCCWSFQKLGVGSDAASSFSTEAEVVELLIYMARIAAKSNRRDLIFDPYPQVMAGEKEVLFDPNNKNYEQVVSVLSKFPSVLDMTREKDFSTLKEKMDHMDPNCYPLLQWIITSNRSLIVLLPKEKRVESMVTPHQYLLLSAPPEKEEIFKNFKEKYGSIFAFHGSGIENWHSILRKGLINASGTKLQVNGAAYGSGIYLSPSGATSFGYSRMNAYNTGNKKTEHSEDNFINSENIFCIAICEVINHEIRKSGNIWVQPHTDYVVTRFLFVYKSADPGTAMNVNTETGTISNELRAALQVYNY